MWVKIDIEDVAKANSCVNTRRMSIEFIPAAYSRADTGFGRDKTTEGDNNFGFVLIESETQELRMPT